MAWEPSARVTSSPWVGSKRGGSCTSSSRAPASESRPAVATTSGVELRYTGSQPELGEKLVTTLKDDYIRRTQAFIVGLQSQARKPVSAAVVFLVQVELLDPTGRPYRNR